MITAPDPHSVFDHENQFYLRADISRFSKFVSHVDLFRMSGSLPGSIVECGIFKGASLLRFIKLRALLENSSARRIIGFDVFGRFPDAGNEGDELLRRKFVEEAGDSGILRPDLETLLADQSLLDGVELVEGDICRTVPEYVAHHPELVISLLHVDVDLYEPTLIALEQFYPRVVPGGIVVLDDYGAFPGATRAIHEYFAGTGAALERLPYSHAITFVRKNAL